MKGTITVAFDYSPERTQVMVTAGMQNQEAKNFSIHILLEAIKVIMNYQHSPIITPASLPNGNGNGLHKLTP